MFPAIILLMRKHMAPTRATDYCRLSSSTPKKFLFAFDIDKTLTCGDAEHALSLVSARDDCDIALVTARPVWPVDSDLRYLYRLPLPPRKNISTCFRPLDARIHVKHLKLDQLVRIGKDYKRVFFFDDLLSTVQYIKSHPLSKRHNVEAYHVQNCNVSDYVSFAISKLS